MAQPLAGLATPVARAGTHINAKGNRNARREDGDVAEMQSSSTARHMSVPPSSYHQRYTGPGAAGVTPYLRRYPYYAGAGRPPPQFVQRATWFASPGSAD